MPRSAIFLPLRLLAAGAILASALVAPAIQTFVSSAPAVAAPGEEPLPEGANAQWFQRTREIGKHYGLGEMFVRQIKQESMFRDDIISGQTLSWAGATGIAQIVPWMHPEVNPLDPEASLHYAAKLMNEHIARFGGDKAKALAAYNAGPGTVDWVVETCGAGWRECLPDETKEYLAKIYVPEQAQIVMPRPIHEGAAGANGGWLTFFQVIRERV